MRSLPQDMMRKVVLCTFTSDDEMLRHLKKYMQFSTKPTAKAWVVNSLAAKREEEEQGNNDKLEAIVTALQSFGWQRKQEPLRRDGNQKSTFVKYPCSLCRK